MCKYKAFLVSTLILKLSYVLAAVTKRYECKLEDVVKKRGSKTLKVSSRMRLSLNNPQTTVKERCVGEIKLDSLEKENEEMKNNSGTE